MQMNYYMDLKNSGKIIKNLRKTKHISQAELAELCGISEGHIKNIESGSKPPGLDVLVKICNALGIPVEYIITNTLRDSSLTLPQFAIIDGLNETQQISCIEMLETFKKKKLGGKL